jgi:hypothetical protein
MVSQQFTFSWPLSRKETKDLIMDDFVYVVRLADRDYFRNWYKVDVLNFWREIKKIVNKLYFENNIEAEEVVKLLKSKTTLSWEVKQVNLEVKL